MKKKHLYRLLLFDLIALAVIFVAVVWIRLDVSFQIQNGKTEEIDLVFTQTLSQKIEILSRESLSSLVKESLPLLLAQANESEENDSTEANKSTQEVESDENNDSFDEIHMTFTGDVLFSASPLNKYDSGGGITSILSEDLLQKMKEADVTMVNLEFPFSNRGTQMKDKQYTFRADPARCSILNEMGVDVVSLANNHTLDFGTDALLDTLTTLEEYKIESVGAGQDLEEAKQPVSMEVGGRKLAFLGASRVIPVTEWNATAYGPGLFTTYDPTLLLEEIKATKENNDFVVVYVHWGIEKNDKPEEYQRTMAQQYIDAGADLVIGSHPHVLQGIEYYKGKPIVYSLGNYVFGHTINQTVLLEVTINKENTCNLRVIPCEAQDAYTHSIQAGEKSKQFYQYYEDISFGIKVDESGNIIRN
ncbi:CapA family protein [Anaerosporobacter faecicola]|uniref:CapA family protein n=1 Tax=Anaerosporobacter faecicola TaxID=2718714 RepID=UPI001EE5A96B|nr:CapA family protein [Anaerosporobacter faecicola]